MQEIRLDTKIADLLNNYEGMKDILIDINPKFKKLNNPILRRTIGRVATVKQAAIVGGMKPLDLLNQLRERVGQKPISQDKEIEEEGDSNEAPEWITTQEPKVSLDANEILDNNENPLSKLNKALKDLKEGEIVVIHSDFRPEPLIEEFSKKGHKVYSQEISTDKFITYIQK
jgi:TusA-related sulfurtransferase